MQLMAGGFSVAIIGGLFVYLGAMGYLKHAETPASNDPAAYDWGGPFMNSLVVVSVGTLMMVSGGAVMNSLQ